MLQVETPTKPRKTMMEKTFVIFIVVPLVAFLTCLNATIAVIRSDGRTNKRRRTNIFTIRNNVWEGTSRCFIPSHRSAQMAFFEADWWCIFRKISGIECHLCRFSCFRKVKASPSRSTVIHVSFMLDSRY